MSKEHQTLLFTATWPKEIQSLARSYLKPDAVQIFVGGADSKLVANKAVTQTFELLRESEKPEALKRILDSVSGGVSKVVVFCNTKINCETRMQEQCRAGRGTCAIHGDKDQVRDPTTNH